MGLEESCPNRSIFLENCDKTVLSQCHGGFVTVVVTARTYTERPSRQFVTVCHSVTGKKHPSYLDGCFLDGVDSRCQLPAPTDFCI